MGSSVERRGASYRVLMCAKDCGVRSRCHGGNTLKKVRCVYLCHPQQRHSTRFRTYPTHAHASKKKVINAPFRTHLKKLGHSDRKSNSSRVSPIAPSP